MSSPPGCGQYFQSMRPTGHARVGHAGRTPMLPLSYTTARALLDGREREIESLARVAALRVEGPGPRLLPLTAEEAGPPEGEDAAVGGHHPVGGGAYGRHPDNRPIEVDRTLGPLKGEPEAEDPSVAGHQAIAGTVGCRLHAHDRTVEDDVPGAAMEGSVEGEDPAVGGYQPVATGGLIGRHPHDGSVQMLPSHRSLVAGVTVREDPAVGGHQPVAPVVGGDRHAHDGLVQSQVGGTAEEVGVTEGEDPAVGGDEPVAAAI